jgi:hypothetical protein
MHRYDNCVKAQGCLIRTQPFSCDFDRDSVLAALGATELNDYVCTLEDEDSGGPYIRIWLDAQHVAQWMPGFNTLELTRTLALDTALHEAHLVREIVVTLLASPAVLEFPSLDELLSAVRIRVNTVQAARKTMLAFGTSEAERPEDYWVYDEDRGFTTLPGVSLIDALRKATQPDVSGALYAFSCYRASEYVILLAIAQELALSNPELFAQLEDLWTHRPVKSGEFHDVFLREQGSMEVPMPPCYFVPGDRTWFRNPDEASADASGFEGSWVMYLGGGLFTNFWKRDEPYTLADKCLEIYHWRDGLFTDPAGDARIDEDKVAVFVKATLQNPAELERVMSVMVRYREPRGVYTAAGGCMDTTREFARWVRPGTADLVIPAA